MDDWGTSSKFVLEKLSEHSALLLKVQEKMVEMQIEISNMKTRFTIIAAAAAVLAGYLPDILKMLLRK